MDTLLVKKASGSYAVWLTSCWCLVLITSPFFMVPVWRVVKELYDQLWDQMEKFMLKALCLSLLGAEALGWFKEPIKSMDDFAKYRFLHTSRSTRSDLINIGVASVAMGGGEICHLWKKGYN